MKDIYNLDLPVIKADMSPPSIRSLEEIEKWLDEMYNEFYNPEVYAREKAKLSVNTVFYL
jgi:hypothetical protein